MRHLAPFVVGALAITASNAYALDHLMKVGEVQISRNGNTAAQFIELEDPAGEPFPNPPYRLGIYDANATQIGSLIDLNVASGTTRYLVVTTAFGGTADTTVASLGLPANGQACFKNAANQNIMCLAWGCINTLILGAERAPSPPDNMSVQRQALGGYHIGTPTPGATNQAGTMAANCPTEPDAPPGTDGPPVGPDGGIPDGGGGGDAGGGSNNGDDGGGCCEVDGSRGTIGFCVLALGVLLSLRASRRKR